MPWFGMSQWPPLVVDGIEYRFDHLQTFAFEMTPKGLDRTVTVVVGFNDHCFNEKFDNTRHTAPLRPPHGARHEARGFSFDRYGDSLRLPDIVSALETKRISTTRYGNYVRLEDDYVVCFTLRKLRPWRRELFVTSAFRGSRSVAKTGSMKFDVAAALVLQGKRTHFPRR